MGSGQGSRDRVQARDRARDRAWDRERGMKTCKCLQENGIGYSKREPEFSTLIS